MTLIQLSAWDERVVQLSTEQATAIEHCELADVRAGPTPGTWRVTTASRVGVVVDDGWELRVSPKMNVPHLMFLLAYARDPTGLF